MASALSAGLRRSVQGWCRLRGGGAVGERTVVPGNMARKLCSKGPIEAGTTATSTSEDQIVYEKVTTKDALDDAKDLGDEYAKSQRSKMLSYTWGFGMAAMALFYYLSTRQKEATGNDARASTSST